MLRHLFINLRPLLLSVALVSCIAGVTLGDGPPPQAGNLLQNGSFMVSGAAALNDWNQINPKNPVTADSEGTDTYITAANADGASTSGVEQDLPAQTQWSKVLLRGYIRVIYTGAVSPSDAQSQAPFVGVQISYVDISGHRSRIPNLDSWLYTTPGWVEINQLVTVPPVASNLIIEPEVDSAIATAYFKKLTLVSWVQTFHDGFDGTSLDLSRWTATTGQHNVRADEQEWFVPDEVTVANNQVRIRAEQKQTGTLPYTSGQISTVNKFQQLYGLFEFQLKLPVTDGAWPAAYLLAWDDDWPPEIDVQELAGREPEKVLNTNHYPDEYGRRRASNVNFPADGLDRTQWHTYSVVWEPGEAAWYLDGVYKGTTGKPYDDVSEIPMYMTINLAVGAFGGDPSQSTWPQDYYCRGVDVYQRGDLPLPLYPEDSQEITLPNNSATLSAISCSPQDEIFSTWSLVEGPAPVLIRSPHSLTTSAVFNRPGMYKFQIKVAKGSDTNAAQLLVYVNRPLGGR